MKLELSDKQIWDLFVVMDQEWALAKCNIKGRLAVIEVAKNFLNRELEEKENKAKYASLGLFNALSVLADACESMGIPVDAAREALAKAKGVVK